MSNKFFLLIGQILISLMFLLVAFSTIMNYQSSLSELESVLAQFFGKQDIGSSVTVSNSYLTHCVLFLNILLQLCGGIFVFFNVSPRIGAFLLMIYMAYSTLLYHPFWLVDEGEISVQLILFLKNLTIFAGLWILLCIKGGIRRPRLKKKNKTGQY